MRLSSRLWDYSRYSSFCDHSFLKHYQKKQESEVFLRYVYIHFRIEFYAHPNTYSQKMMLVLVQCMCRSRNPFCPNAIRVSKKVEHTLSRWHHTRLINHWNIKDILMNLNFTFEYICATTFRPCYCVYCRIFTKIRSEVPVRWWSHI